MVWPTLGSRKAKEQNRTCAAPDPHRANMPAALDCQPIIDAQSIQVFMVIDVHSSLFDSNLLKIYITKIFDA